jgi:hypothetical protein
MGYYLFAIWGNINCLLKLFTLCLGSMAFVGLLGSIITCAYPDDEHKFFTKLLKKVTPYFIAMATFFAFLPSQKQLAFIIAAPYIVENQQLQEASKNSAEIIKLGTEYVKDVLTTATTKKGE